MATAFHSRRTILKAGTAAALGVVAAKVCSAAPAAETITPELVAAAKKEGHVVWYTSADLALAEKVGRAFERAYPGVTAQVERAGGERIFTRIAQEYAANIFAVDAVSTGDAAQFINWKRRGWLAPCVPEDVARHIPAAHRDPDGMFATVRWSLCVIAYNTALVARAEAPKSFADLLDPKWTGKIVKAHPSYSGTVITATYQLVQTLGWEYLEKLAKQKIFQVQSATDTPKKIALGERAIMADGNEYNVVLLKTAGQPVEIVYASEGSPVIHQPAAILARAAHPNAARLFHNYLFTVGAQEFFTQVGGLRSVHALVKERPGMMAIGNINLMKDDPVAVEAQSDEIKRHYSQIFGI